MLIVPRKPNKVTLNFGEYSPKIRIIRTTIIVIILFHDVDFIMISIVEDINPKITRFSRMRCSC